MASDLYSLNFGGQAVGTITGDAFDLGNIDTLEIFMRAGTAASGPAATVTVLVDSIDVDGNIALGAGGSFAAGSATITARSIRRGMPVGTAVPVALGVQGRVRTVVAGSQMQCGVNVVGF